MKKILIEEVQGIEAKEVTIVALLDKPLPSSFANVPFVAREVGGVLRIHGFDAKTTITHITRRDLYNLIRDGHARHVNIEIIIGPPPERYIVPLRVGWIGSTFKQRNNELGLSEISFPRQLFNIFDEEEYAGGIWISSPANINHAQEKWIEAAALQVFTTEDKEQARKIAELMEWCLPDHEATCAASWFTQTTATEKADQLSWLLRLARDNGNETTEEYLTQNYHHIRQTIRQHHRQKQAASK